MDGIECIKTRKSVREFEEKQVDDELVEKILEAGINAPSAGNI